MSRPPRMPLAEALAQLPAWTAVEGKDAVFRSFKFRDFTDAFRFMTRAAMMADKLDHHPEWFNVYSRVDVLLNTHDADGVTALDVELAKYMDEVAAGIGVAE